MAQKNGHLSFATETCSTLQAAASWTPATTYLKPSRGRFRVEVVRRMSVNQPVVLPLPPRVQVRAAQPLNQELRLEDCEHEDYAGR